MKGKGAKFENTKMEIILVHVLKINVEFHETKVCINIQGRSIRALSFFLPFAKDNQTSDGTHFLRKAGIIFDIAKQNCTFIRNPKKRFNFIEDYFSTSE